MLKSIIKFINNIVLEWRKQTIMKKVSWMENETELYVVSFRNTNNHRAKAVMFGYNLFAHKENFGSDKGIVTVIQNANEYAHVLFESQMRFDVGKIRYCTSLKEVDKNTLFWLVRKRADGFETRNPINIGEFADEYRFQKSVVDYCTKKGQKMFSTDGSSYFEFDMKPNEEIVISFYKAKKETEENATRKQYEYPEY